MSFLPVNTGGKVYAAICVSYAKGETCTCSGGGRTWEAKNTDGEWVFPVPRAGEYTVAAGERSETVNVTKEGQGFLVNLASLRLIIAGEGYASGYSMTAAAGNVSVNSAKAVEIKGAANANAYAYFPEVDVTSFSTMKLRVKGFTVCTYGLGSASALSYSVRGESNNSAEETLSLDVSGVSGKYRPAVHVNLYSTDTVATIYEWWFE